ncbi:MULTISPECIES: hypothetical protein [Pseudomonas syringae group]|uniref:Uncharacterized protein n=1 Tax=Pseudomonas syringae pv. tomato TaxID=323 RepID=A0AAP6MGL8_PSEUB|nr:MULTISPECIES: hypothetical protein [Pseudomonas syringae group]KUR44658.1 hypothetical protein PST407_04061 [Pseudomonas syringae pv. tomato]KUR48296.1 hypothetical protein PSTA9_01066 [Pseudomonas syringae pv. tomato]MDT3236321.1 hypothetical protein [Pseudomonas syringae pv. tomato]MEA1762343.1 hypothetical protein [Pseudomonas syringae pv. tomato]RMQ70344.1 hypothetical protein ALP99_00553 [Pseudomonas syringae pv. tomato]
MLVRAHTHVKDLTANPGSAKKKKIIAITAVSDILVFCVQSHHQ